MQSCNQYGPSPWTDERVATLRKLWADGLSASKIARSLGHFAHCRDGGRSAVIGKVHRLGLSGRSRSSFATCNANKLKAARKKAKITFVPNRIIKPTKREVLRAELAIIAALEPLGAEISHAAGCRYIAGDPQMDSRVCGRATAGGSWCEQHRKLVYQPSAPKARVRSPESDERARWRRDLKQAAAGMVA